MQQQILVIVTGLSNLPSIYGYKTKDAAKEGVQKLIKKGISSNSIIVAQEIPMNIEIQVDVEF
ncbi:hypothetical protein ORM79_03930 [Bacillus cereus]|uniref:hypothetical protein n=1 Tax=Bacillus cereus group TaxID=86661 RepID=UPI0001A12F22|nr:hypothetical protein [Bacillus cereus]EEL73121.1 hypothetical protein bcere0027_56290 [Bacillus cereus AH676]KMP41406.1 hypothetical protein TU56_27115 [Bacillus cereus]MDZ4471962.1 hypothetical protein [Bacillus cereus]MEB9883282.1 hypothetical protein [Bacillus cereus]HDR4450776.1 hypothetical protein [Bacillus cereus]